LIRLAVSLLPSLRHVGHHDMQFVMQMISGGNTSKSNWRQPRRININHISPNVSIGFDSNNLSDSLLPMTVLLT
jgi:hypothetical protein